jgi:penicillin-binding protein 1A
VGYDNSQASLGNKETGARAALPIWINVMAKALEGKPAENFAATDDVVFVKIDPENGLLAREGAAEVYSDVFRRGTEPTQYADSVKKSKTDFFSLDQGDGGEAPKTKINPEEITD